MLMTNPVKYYLYVVISDKENNGNTGTSLVQEFATEVEAQTYAVKLKAQKYFYDYKIIDTIITNQKLTAQTEKFYLYAEIGDKFIFYGEYTEEEQVDLAMDRLEDELKNNPDFIRTFCTKTPL